MLVTKKFKFEMAHRLANHNGACLSNHGHSYSMIVGVEGPICEVEGDSSEGMVIDYTDLKQIVNENIINPFDHSVIVWTKDIFSNMWLAMSEGRYIDNDGNWQQDESQSQKVLSTPFRPTAENFALYFYQILKEKLPNVKFVEVNETRGTSARYEE